MLVSIFKLTKIRTKCEPTKTENSRIETIVRELLTGALDGHVELLASKFQR